MITGVSFLLLCLVFNRTIRRDFWRLRVSWLYTRYHNSFMDNILEAQQRRNLPQVTIVYKNKFNRALDKLRQVDPETHWRKLP